MVRDLHNMINDGIILKLLSTFTDFFFWTLQGGDRKEGGIKAKVYFPLTCQYPVCSFSRLKFKGRGMGGEGMALILLDVFDDI